MKVSKFISNYTYVTGNNTIHLYKNIILYVWFGANTKTSVCDPNHSCYTLIINKSNNTIVECSYKQYTFVVQTF